MSVITYPVDGVTYSATDAETYMCTRSTGIYAETGNFEATCTGEDRVVTIGTGIAWINDGEFTGKSICSTEEASVTFSAVSEANSRYCRIVLRYDRTTVPSSSYFTIIYGTEAVSPTVPDIVRDDDYYDIGLYIVYQGRGTTVITADNITSTIADSSVCGIMTDAITDATPTTIQTQYETLLARYKEAILLAEDDATNAHVLKAESIETDEVRSILEGNEPTTEYRYLDEKGVGIVGERIDEVAADLEEHIAAYSDGNKFTVNIVNCSSSLAGTTKTFENENGFRDILVQHGGFVAYVKPIKISVNDSETTINLTQGYTYTGTNSATQPYSIYTRFNMLGQFVQIEQIGALLTDSSNVYDVARTTLTHFDDTCAIKKFSLVFPSGYSGNGTLYVYTR